MTVMKDERLAVRVTSGQKALIERAATASGNTLTEFSVSAIVSRAEEVLSERPFIVLSDTDWHQFLGLLEAPQSSDELARLLHRPTPFTS